MFQTIEEYENGPQATEAERGLIAACRAGKGYRANGGALPTEGSTNPDITIRADLIRLLALEKTSLHEAGVWLEGALITGMLDLRFAKCRGRLVLDKCRFAERLRMGQADLAELSLEGSHFPGLFAQGAKVAGSVFLRDVTATGTVDVNAAQIGGQLVCKGATLNGGGGMALRAQGALVTGDVFLDGVTAEETVDVAGAQIGGQFSCDGATLNGGKGKALIAQSLQVETGFYFRDVNSVTGRVDLTSAHASGLVDDAASWDKCTDVVLDGFTYDRIGGNTAAKTFAARQSWLEKGSRFEGEFFPQPYTQFAKVMRATGHAGEARKALMGAQQATALHFRDQARIKRRIFRAYRLFSRRETPARAAAIMTSLDCAQGAMLGVVTKVHEHFKLTHRPWPTPPKAPTPPDAMMMDLARQDFRNQMWAGAAKARLDIGFNWIKDFLSRHVIGYGYAPHRALWAMVALVLPSAWFFSYAYAEGAMVPNSDVVLTSASWFWALLMDGQAPTGVWDDGAVARHYETFYALAYAFDVFVPIVDLGQQTAWTATTVSWLGWGARMGTMVLEVLGWIVTALAAASVTGLVQKNAPD